MNARTSWKAIWLISLALASPVLAEDSLAAAEAAERAHRVKTYEARKNHTAKYLAELESVASKIQKRNPAAADLLRKEREAAKKALDREAEEVEKLRKAGVK